MSDPQRSVSDSPHSQQGWRRRPEYRNQFDIAIVCALPLEYDAVTLLVDEFWDETGDSYGRAVGDSNSYTTGRIGTHNVVVALLPGMGKVNAAVAVGGLRASYTDIKLVLLVGICGGVPRAGNNDEILLGDVIISETVVQYDYGRRYPDSFATKTAIGEGFSRPNTDIRGLLAFLRSEAGLGHLQQRTSYFLHMLQQRASQRRRSNYNYPGAASDKLFAPDHRHRHHGPCSCICSQWKVLSDPVCQEALSIPCSQTGCGDANLMPRRRLEMRHELEKQKERIDIQEPLIFVGRIASGDTVMKSGKDRDRIAKEQNVIAFEMEGAGFWEELPCLVVKGVCDYADSHKDKLWQTFAAATAAATMKALIEKYIRTDRQLLPSTVASSGFASAQSWDTASPKLANNSTASQNEPWRDCIVQAALRHLPRSVHGVLATILDTNVTSKEWNAKLSEIIKATPDTPSWLSHTAPYERFVSELENIIWYQTIDPEVGAGVDLEHECEDITISLLGDLERWEVKRRVEQIAQARKLDRSFQRPNEPVLRKRKRKIKRQYAIPTSEAGLGTSFLGLPIVPGNEQQGEVSGKTPSLSRIKRVYLFYTPTEKSENDEPFVMSPLQSFLWSLVSQALLWKTSSMGLFLDWNGVVDPQTSCLSKIPEVSELKDFLWNLIKIQGSPVVITVCRADVLLHTIGREPIEFLANLCNSTVTLGVRVFLILSTLDQTSTLPGVKSSQVLNRYTERDECLGNLQFEGQCLRRDEVSAADTGTNTWIWTHPAFLAWQNKSSGVLWIEGKAGSGKSVLAKTIKAGLSESWDSDRRGIPLPQISDWFYSTRHGRITRSHVYFLRSIVRQLLEQNKNVFPMYASVYREKKNQSESWEFEDYENILVKMAAHSTRAICIVDAMDESDDDQGSFYLRRRVITLMARLVEPTGSQIRFIVLSRYTADIDRVLHQIWKKEEKLFHLVLERENTLDVALLIDNGLAALKEAMSELETDTEDELDTRHYLSPQISTAQDDDDRAFERMREFLLEHTQGVILWIKLTIQVLIERVRGALYNTRELEADLRSLPMDLVNFYNLILRDLKTRYPEGLGKTRMALMWVVGASAIRPLALDELYEAISVPLVLEPDFLLHQEDPMIRAKLSVRAKTWIGFYRQLRVRCGPFIEIIVPQNHHQKFSFSENTEVSPRFTIQLLHRTVKDFLHDAGASGPLSFSQQEADLLVRGSLERYLQLVLPVQASRYCPVPARAGSDAEAHGAAIAMAEYLNHKNLLELAISTLPEEKWLNHLVVFERSVYPPLMAQREHMLWNRRLYEICLRYFTHVCDKGLTTAVVNLLTIASTLILSWPTSLRYGPLARAIKECALSMGHLLDDTQNPSRCEAISMVYAFSRTEQSLVWECEGVAPHCAPRVKIPDRGTLADSIAGFDGSHGKRSVKRDQPASPSPISRQLQRDLLCVPPHPPLSSPKPPPRRLSR